MENIRIQMMLKAKPLIEPGHDELGIFDKHPRPFYISYKLTRLLHIALKEPFIPTSIFWTVISRWLCKDKQQV